MSEAMVPATVHASNCNPFGVAGECTCGADASAGDKVHDIELLKLPITNGVAAVTLFGMLRPSTLAHIIVELEEAEDHDTWDLREAAMHELVANEGHGGAAEYIVAARQGE